MIEFKQAGFTCSPRFSLRDMNFKIEPGMRVLLHGPNGSGKTTLLRLMAGLLPIHNGGRIAAIPAGNIHLSGHQPAVYPTLSVRQNLDFWLSMAIKLGKLPNFKSGRPGANTRTAGEYGWHYEAIRADEAAPSKKTLSEKIRDEAPLKILPQMRIPARAQVAAQALRHALELFGLLDLADEKAGNLSRGTSQRLDLARIFMLAGLAAPPCLKKEKCGGPGTGHTEQEQEQQNEPSLILLDEPENSLESQYITKLQDAVMVIQPNASNTALVWASHVLCREEACQMTIAARPNLFTHSLKLEESGNHLPEGGWFTARLLPLREGKPLC